MIISVSIILDLASSSPTTKSWPWNRPSCDRNHGFELALSKLGVPMVWSQVTCSGNMKPEEPEEDTSCYSCDSGEEGKPWAGEEERKGEEKGEEADAGPHSAEG